MMITTNKHGVQNVFVVTLAPQCQQASPQIPPAAAHSMSITNVLALLLGLLVENWDLLLQLAVALNQAFNS